MKSQNLIGNIINASLLVSTISLIAKPVLAGIQDFKFHNNTSKKIEQLYVSASRSDNWEEDVLGRDILRGGETTRINFPNSNPNICSYDIRVVFTDKSVVEKRGFNLCQLTDISIP
ncbi:hypothetical protein [Merismopedia glauca]|uniref:Uncharacterized protein n=1 Tax=Merismopedia glauca CCAP 1448/3 TaxID=1296344 RepID=A0A2T1BY59_9CYAN|nr:hypothetical protein [Merismopedia glauca]PSB00960.1 hypothetical protein C7B64_20850 [Merismopedia glauca CCAP 1448/3]